MGVEFGHHEGSLARPLVVVVGDGPFRNQGPLRWNRVIKNKFLLAVKYPGQIDVAFGGELGA